MRRFLTFRAKRALRPFRQRGLAGAFVLALAGGLGVAAPAVAAHAPPQIDSPDPGAFVATGIVTVRGVSGGDAILVRVSEGGTALADVGPELGYWSADIAFSEGMHTITASSKDETGAWSAPSAAVTFTVDSVAPDPPVVTAPADGQLLGFSDVTVEGTAEPGTTVTLEISTGGSGSSVADAGGSWRITRAFTDTSHTVSARAADRAGNTSRASAPVTFTVDTIAPAAPQIQTPAPGMTFGSTTVRIAGTAEPGTTVTVFEGAAIAAMTASTGGTWAATATFGEGTHSITARASDAAGNVSPAAAPVPFTVDLTAPPAPVIAEPAQGALLPSKVTVRGSAEPRASVLLIVGSTLRATTQADAGGAWSIPLELFSGPHQIRARARDAGGNFSPLSPLRDFTVDAEPPSVDVTTRRETIFLPADDVLIEGTAADNLGVLGVELEFYDALGHAVSKVNANRCLPCPTGDSIAWSSDHAPGIGRFTVKAYAVDRVGNRSLVDTTTIIRI